MIVVKNKKGIKFTTSQREGMGERVLLSAEELDRKMDQEQETESGGISGRRQILLNVLVLIGIVVVGSSHLMSVICLILIFS